MRKLDVQIHTDGGVKSDQPPETSEFPIPIAENWEDLVARSARAAEVIDRHLEFESRLQGRELRPITLCPEQKVSMASDLAVV